VGRGTGCITEASVARGFSGPAAPADCPEVIQYGFIIQQVLSGLLTTNVQGAPVLQPILTILYCCKSC
jgi:hypothetical protein